jgi:nicotinamide-nucleotide amidase
MNAEIICVGTELLLGDIVNTNARFIARELSALGISVYHQQVVGDNSKRLASVAKEAKGRSDIVVYTGGLGPTEDDLTKQTIASIYNDELIFNKEVYDKIAEHFNKIHSSMAKNNERQAYVPKRGRYIENEKGTAPGIIFFDGEKMAILLPGVPFEMENMVTKHVVPLLKKLSKGVILSRFVHVIGIGESALEPKIKDILDGDNPTAALYAKNGEISIRLTRLAKDKETADAMLNSTYSNIDSRIHNFIYGVDTENIESVIVDTLKKSGCTVATAESCTGGSISARITSVPGASEVFALGVCTYSNEQKKNVLNVPKEHLDLYTAVSQRVAADMARGVLQKAERDYAVATTGYAGPGGGTESDPVGTVYISVATKENTFVKRCSFSGDRRRVIRLAGQSAFDMLRCVMNNLPCAGMIVTDTKPLELDKTEKSARKTGGIFKKVLTVLLLAVLASVLAFGFLKLKYKDDFKLPFYISIAKRSEVTEKFSR